MTIRPTQTITIEDARTFEGDAYQVAERAIQQTRALGALFLENLESVDLMARNAELERQLALGASGEDLRAGAATWPESPQGRRLKALSEALSEALEALPSLEKAVAFNPKAAVGGRRAR